MEDIKYEHKNLKKVLEEMKEKETSVSDEEALKIVKQIIYSLEKIKKELEEKLN